MTAALSDRICAALSDRIWTALSDRLTQPTRANRRESLSVYVSSFWLLQQDAKRRCVWRGALAWKHPNVLKGTCNAKLPGLASFFHMRDPNMAPESRSSASHNPSASRNRLLTTSSWGASLVCWSLQKTRREPIKFRGARVVNQGVPQQESNHRKKRYKSAPPTTKTNTEPKRPLVKEELLRPTQPAKPEAKPPSPNQTSPAFPSRRITSRRKFEDVAKLTATGILHDAAIG